MNKFLENVIMSGKGVLQGIIAIKYLQTLFLHLRQ
jgi:hypothetical protein